VRKVFGYILYSAFCLTALGAGTAMAVFERNPLLWAGFQQSAFYPSFLAKPDPLKGRDNFFVLLLGCDENRYYSSIRSGKPGQILDQRARTDTIQLIRLDLKNKSIGMMQIPRDTFVEVPGYSSGKINGLHVAGGPEATAEGVTMLTGIRPDRVVLLDYPSIVKMIDEVGGVEIMVDKRMKYDDDRGDLHVDLKPGRQLLNGLTALGYLRWRHDSDLFRGSRQQDFLVAFKEKVMGNGMGLRQVYRLSSLAMKVVGGGITADEFVAIGKFAQDVPASRIKHGRLPVREGRGTYLVFEPENLQSALEESGLIDPVPKAHASAVR
jgi:LCP family protein required for cell wall assembly